MDAALRLADPMLPPAPGGLGRGALLALVVHGGLVIALALGVQWRAQPVAVVAAELWSSVPQQAAPAPAPVVAPEPPAPEPAAQPQPAPTAEPEADIAIQRQRAERERLAQAEAERRERAEKERRERAEADRRERAEKTQRDERERKAAETRLAQLREENLKRMLGQAGGATGGGGSGTAAQDSAPSLAYGSRLIAHIKPNIVFTASISGNPTAEVEVRAAPSGSIIARRLVKSSGVKEWDEAVLRAIDRTGALPRDRDGRVPSLLIIGFRPND